MIDLKQGMYISPTRLITNSQIKYWRYSSECGDVGGGLVPGTMLRVADVNLSPGSMWVRASIPGSHPASYLKIFGGEFGSNFKIHK